MIELLRGALYRLGVGRFRARDPAYDLHQRIGGLDIAGADAHGSKLRALGVPEAGVDPLDANSGLAITGLRVDIVELGDSLVIQGRDQTYLKGIGRNEEEKKLGQKIPQIIASKTTSVPPIFRFSKPLIYFLFGINVTA